MAAPKAYVNEHDTVIFEDDVQALEEETGVTLQDYLDAGYREVEPPDRIVLQAAEISPVDPTDQSPRPMTFGDLADATEGSTADLPGRHPMIVGYVRKVRALRAAQDKARPRDNPEPRVTRKGKNGG